jgi:hypothetical protein
MPYVRGATDLAPADRVTDQAFALQQLQVLADGDGGDREDLGQLAGGFRSPGLEEIEDLVTGF